MVRTKKSKILLPISPKEEKEEEDNNKNTLNDNKKELNKVTDLNDNNNNTSKMQNNSHMENIMDQYSCNIVPFIPYDMDPALYNFKVIKIQHMFAYLAPRDIYKMLEDCLYNEDEVILRLITQPNYLYYIQTLLHQEDTNTLSFSSSNQEDKEKELIEKTTKGKNTSFLDDRNNHIIVNNNNKNINTIKSELANEEDTINPQIIKPLSPPYSIEPLSSSSSSSISSLSTSLSLSEPSELPIIQKIESPKKQKTKLHQKKKTKPMKFKMDTIKENISLKDNDNDIHSKTEKKRIRTIGRLPLDDALKQVKNNKDSTEAYAGWSEARLRAYRMLDNNPNSYYYRFNAPGEEQHKGAWTSDEKVLFLKRLKELGANSQWGIFSMAIPGRVGYQCSNFYRLLIENGEIKDSNYVIDEKGKARFLFDKKSGNGEVKKEFRTHTKHSRKINLDDEKPTTIKRKKKKKIETRDDDSDDDEYCGKYIPKRKYKPRKK